MLRSRFLTVLSTALFVSISVSHPTPPRRQFNWADTKYLIAFGDSYTYVQGTHGLQNYSFIGDAFHLNFSPAELLSNRIVQNQTATAEGGPNWVEFLTGCGLQPGLTDPQTCAVQLWDFAFAGADVSTAYTPLHHNFTVSLVNQTAQFVASAEPVLKTFVAKPQTLVVFWIGINDIGDSDQDRVASFPALYEQMISTQFASVEQIYELGYRNFLVMKLPPLNRTPPNLVRAAGPLPNATMVQEWDDTLANHSRDFERTHEGSRVMVFETTEFLNRVLDHAAEFGIRNTTGYCPAYDQPEIDTEPAKYGCLPLDEYFWFNTGHLTSHTHQILAAEVEVFLKNQSACAGPGGGHGHGV